MPSATLYAINREQRLVHAKSALRDAHYSCPRCGDDVILRRGEIKIAHFAHKAESACTSETIAHKTAKLLIFQVFSDWKLGQGQELIVEVGCNFYEFCDNTVKYPIRDKVTAARIEYIIGSHRADVMFTKGDDPVLAIEVKVSHAVDDHKAESLPIYFIEVDAEDVIKDPRVLRDNRHEHNREYLTDLESQHNWKAEHRICPQCESKMREFEDAKHQIASACGVTYDSEKYKAGIDSCYKCKKPILRFNWSDDESWSTKLPPQPIPQTVQYRHSHTVGHKYWANTCPYCGAIQGDFYSYETAWDFTHDGWSRIVHKDSVNL